MHCSGWPHGLGLIDVGLGLARFFWPRPWPWPWPHDTVASLTSLPVTYTCMFNHVVGSLGLKQRDQYLLSLFLLECRGT